MEKEGKYKYLAKNTLLFTISSFGSKFLVFLLVPLYTNLLTTSEYGMADIITTSAYLLMYVFTINIADAVMRFAIDQKEKQLKYLSYGFKISFMGAIAVAFLLVVLQQAKLSTWTQECYILLFFDFLSISIYQLVSNYLRALDKVKEVAISGTLTTLITIIFNIVLLVCFQQGLRGYLLSLILGQTVASMYCLFVIKNIGIDFIYQHCSRIEKRSMRRYSIPLIFNSVAWWMNNSLDKYFVIWLCGAAENGILSVAYKIPTILSVFHSVFSQAWNLSAIKEFDKDDKDGFFSKTYSLYNAGMMIVCSGLILLNIPIAKLLFAKDFFEAWKYSSLLLIATMFSSISSIIGSIFSAAKDSKVFAFSTVISAILNCILNMVLITMWGTIGAAIATVVSFVCVWYIRLLCSRKYIKMKISLKKDMFAYTLIILQVVFEHMNGHMYLGQFIVFFAIVMLYRQHVLSFARKCGSVIKR